MARPIEYASVHLSFEKYALHAGHEVLTCILLIVGNPQGILDWQLRPHPIHLSNIIIKIINLIKFDVIKFG